MKVNSSMTNKRGYLIKIADSSEIYMLCSNKLHYTRLAFLIINLVTLMMILFTFTSRL